MMSHEVKECPGCGKKAILVSTGVCFDVLSRKALSGMDLHVWMA